MERDITYSESALFKFISMESFVQWWFIFQSEDNQKPNSLLLGALLFYLNLQKADSSALKLFFKQEKEETSSVIRTVFLRLVHETT